VKPGNHTPGRSAAGRRAEFHEALISGGVIGDSRELVPPRLQKQTKRTKGAGNGAETVGNG
jgi:hypothetical protein